MMSSNLLKILKEKLEALPMHCQVLINLSSNIPDNKLINLHFYSKFD